MNLKSKRWSFKNASIDGIVTIEMVSNILKAQNFSMPAGYMETSSDKMIVKVGEKVWKHRWNKKI